MEETVGWIIITLFFSGLFILQYILSRSSLGSGPRHSFSGPNSNQENRDGSSIGRKKILSLSPNLAEFGVLAFGFLASICTNLRHDCATKLQIVFLGFILGIEFTLSIWAAIQLNRAGSRNFRIFLASQFSLLFVFFVITASCVALAFYVEDLPLWFQIIYICTLPGAMMILKGLRIWWIQNGAQNQDRSHQIDQVNTIQTVSTTDGRSMTNLSNADAHPENPTGPGSAQQERSKPDSKSDATSALNTLVTSTGTHKSPPTSKRVDRYLNLPMEIVGGPEHFSKSGSSESNQAFESGSPREVVLGTPEMPKNGLQRYITEADPNFQSLSTSQAHKKHIKLNLPVSTKIFRSRSQPERDPANQPSKEKIARAKSSALAKADGNTLPNLAPLSQVPDTENESVD